MLDRYASLKQGLVGCWIPSVSGSGLLLPDLSGRNNNGSLVGMDASDWVSASYGRALDFDGVNDAVVANLSPAITLGKNATVSAWAKTITTSGNQPVFTVGGRFTGFITITLRGIPPLSAIFELWDLTNNPNIIVSVNANQWYHLAGVFQEGVMTFYIDGKVAGTLNNATTQATNIPSQIVARIGNNTDYNLWLTGQADDARVYNRALSASEIRLLASEPGIGFKPAKKLSRFSQRFTYNPPKARNYGVVRVKETDYATLRQGLVGAWCPSLPNGGSGNLLVDQSQRGNHGTLTNMSAGAWVSSGSGRALDFDGTDDYSQIGDVAAFRLSQQTLSCWIKVGSQTVPKVIYSSYSQTSAVAGFNVGLNVAANLPNNTLSCVVGNNQGFNIGIHFSHWAATGTVTDNIWHHIAVTLATSGAVQFYIDGIAVTSTGTNIPAVYATNNYVNIATEQTDATTRGKYWPGQIDDLRIYSRILTAAEIRLLASRPGIGLRQESHRNTFYQFPSGARRKRILTGMP